LNLLLVLCAVIRVSQMIKDFNGVDFPFLAAEHLSISSIDCSYFPARKFDDADTDGCALEDGAEASFAGFEFQGLSGITTIGDRRHQRQSEYHESDDYDSEGSKRRDAYGVRQVLSDRYWATKSSGCHACVVHDWNGCSHDQSA